MAGPAYPSREGGGKTVPIGPVYNPFFPCVIATISYDTPLFDKLGVLREFRDTRLKTNPIGDAVVRMYYKVSPPMADFVRERGYVKAAAREFFMEPCTKTVARILKKY